MRTILDTERRYAPRPTKDPGGSAADSVETRPIGSNNHPARLALLAVAAAAAAATIALVPVLASPAHAEPVALPTPSAPPTAAAALAAKLPLPTPSSALPVTASLALPTSAPVTAKLPTTAVPLPSAKASLPAVRVSAGPVKATPGPVTAALPPGSSSLPSAATPNPVGRGSPPPLGYDSRLDARHHLDSLPADLLNTAELGAGLTPNALGGPGVGRSGVVGRQSVAAPSLTQSSPLITRGLLVLAVLAILALSVATAEYARAFLLRQRPVR
jgi:hypothetical protein